MSGITREAVVGGVRLGVTRLAPGSVKTCLEDGGDIVNSKEFRSLEDHVGEIIFLATGGDKSGGGLLAR